MARMVLHRIRAGHYTADGLLDVTQFPPRGPWRVNTPGTAAVLGDWLVRNPVCEQRFTTLREARDYLQALWAVDPPPTAPLSKFVAKITRTDGDGYELSTEAGLFQIRPTPDGWEVLRNLRGIGLFPTRLLAIEQVADLTRLHECGK